jgi:signal transduction histidine kinase/PAS domain-containing protein
MSGVIPHFKLKPVRPAVVGHYGMIGNRYLMTKRTYSKSLVKKFRAFLVGTAVFNPASKAFAADAAQMNVMGVTIGSLEVIQFSMFIGAMGAALLAAVWLIRERGKMSGQNLALRSRIADLTVAIERSDVLLSSRDCRIVVWDSNAQKPEVIGALSTGSGAPSDQAHFLAFNRWMTPSACTLLEAMIKALRERGVAFEKGIETITGEQLEVHGRRTGSTSFVRFMGLTGIQAENSRLKRDLDGLKTSTDLVTALLDNLSFPVWRRDQSGILAYSNKAYAKMIENDRGRESPANNELFGSQARELIERKRQPDGRFNDQVSTVINGDRAVFEVIDMAKATGSIGLARDVSELDSLREEFERTLRSQSDTLNQLTTAVAIFDSNQKLRSFNNAFQKLWGLDVSFLETNPEHGIILDRLRTDGKLPEQQEWRRWREQLLSAYRAPEGTEDWWHLPDGKSLRVLGNPQPKGGMIWVFENMTEKFDLESRYNTLIKIQGETLDNLAEGVAVFGSDGKVRLSNPAFAVLWALPEDMSKEGVHISAIRAACKDLAPAGEWDMFVGSATGFDDARDARQGQIELKSGTVLAYAQVPLPKGQTMLTFVDISDTVHMERALKDRNEALQRADMLKNDFIQHVSYELRSPLTNIIGFTEMLQQHSTGPLSERQSDYLDHIAVSSSSLLTTVNDILDLATVDAGIMDLEITAIDIASLFTAVEKSFARRFKEAGVQLATQTYPGAGQFKADAQRLRQIIDNLLSNAVNHGPQGSVVTLSASRMDNDIIISIHDEGPGIAKDILDTVFDRFVAHPSGGRRGGTGLGLSIVKGLVELHHGTVDIASKPGIGTKVECRFPVDPARYLVAAE